MREDSKPEESILPDRDYLMDLLKNIISFRTVAPPGDCYQEIVEWLEPIFRDMGFETTKMKMPAEVFAAKCSDSRLVGDRYNLRADLSVGAEKTLVIYAHLDVVPAEGEWDTDPFCAVQKNGRVYGRGVSDCKGSVAALVAALKALLSKEKPKYNLSILLTTDEEVGGYSGLCYLTDLGQVKGDLMLCMDGFSDDVGIGSNGIITWDVMVKGRSDHSGSSFLGVNAVERSIPVMERLMDLKKVVQARRSRLPASSPVKSVGIENLMPILNITMVNGGVKENIVPDRCVLRGDRRVIPEERMEEAMEEIERALEPLRSEGIDFELKFYPGYPPMSVNPEHAWVNEVREAVERGMGFMPQLSAAQGSLDQAYATEKTGIPTCVYGVGRQLESNIHAPNENVRITDLEGYTRFLIELLQ
ncbi:MAG: ArgE/DapE family deacylase [Methanothrix sp.]|jgi:succinyl-diaminopimelate desuccinylase|uniref:M20 family metallopeptidase n=1 Tax=Methanothrix sp. TaxID=90426 RepID=UPI003BB805D5